MDVWVENPDVEAGFVHCVTVEDEFASREAFDEEEELCIDEDRGVEGFEVKVRL